MRRFIRHTLIFGCIIIALLAVCEIAGRMLPGVLGTKSAWMREHADSVETLVLGHSHPFYGVRPDILGAHCYSLTYPSQTPEIDLGLLKMYIDSMPRLRRVIVAAAYFTYREPKYEDRGPDEKYPVRYKVEMDAGDHSDFSVYNLLMYDFDYLRNKLTSPVLFRPHIVCDSLGHGEDYVLARRYPLWQTMGEARVKDHSYPASRRDITVLKIHKEIAAICRGHGVEPIFIVMPVWPSYTEAIDRTPAYREQYDEMRRHLATLHDDYGATYYDFFNDRRFSGRDFYDVDHLSEYGSVKFTEILRDTLRQEAAGKRPDRPEAAP